MEMEEAATGAGKPWVAERRKGGCPGCSSFGLLPGANELLKADEIIVQIDSRSIAVSHIPHNVKLEDVQSFFGQYGKVNIVRLPKHVSNKRQFSGTSLVEFSEEVEANNIMNNKLSFAGADLEIKTKKEFDAEMEAKKEAYEKSHPNTHPNKNGHDEG
ncbi:la protein 1-like [Aegilops tauschii subsp. strangulata]|uniref:la protein 1-like n=1 Tax=Aegilops tauschii subsp. strangulata TaxID=200361 RepID=UPI001E1C9E85|nr:la protein 1-like [Aegilops tauschii subsp. strangulata]